MQQNLIAAFKDWKTTVPGILTLLFAVLSMTGAITLTPEQQMATLFLVTGIIGIAANGLKDPTTTIPALLSAVIGVLSIFGIALPLAVAAYIATLILFFVALFGGGVTDWKTTVPAVLIAAFGLCQWLGLPVPIQIQQSITLFANGLIALLLGQPLPVPELPGGKK